MSTLKMRTDALLSRYGYCSRREAASWVKAGKVIVQGEVVKKPDQKVDVREVLVQGEPVDYPEGLFVAFYKPLGCTCSHDDQEGELIYDLLPALWSRRNPVATTIGRLDKETSGLIFITDQGEWVHRLTSPKHKVEKVYEFTTELPIPESAVEVFASGELMLKGERTPLLPAQLTVLGPCEGRLVLSEGRYHQVRRMMESQGAPVVTLHRSAFGAISLESLALNEGEWVSLDPKSILSSL